MKRKFGITLGHLRMPKTDTEDLEDRLSRPYSPPASPFIDRQPIDSTTEAELKAACAAVARDYKPTKEEAQERRQADARASQIARSHRDDAVRKLNQAKYANAQVDAYPGAVAYASKHTFQPNPLWNDIVKEPTHSRQTPATTNAPKQRESRQLKSSTVVHPPRRSSLLPPASEVAAVLANAPESQQNTALVRQSSDSAPSTPRSASTDLRFGHPSTDPTSAAWSPERSSKHTSRSHLPIEAIPGPRTNPLSDAWFYREYKRGTPPEESSPERNNLTEVRSQSRGRKFRNQLGEYIKPSLPNSSTVSLSGHVFKTWGPSKRTSQPVLPELRPARTSQLDSEPQSRGRSRAPVDLNRDLPPLPSLNQWQDPTRKPYNHVATLMRDRSGSGSQTQVRDSRRNTQAFQSTPNLHGSHDIAVAQAVTLRAFVGTRKESDSSIRDDPTKTVDRLTSRKDAYDRYVGSVAQQRMDSMLQQQQNLGHTRQLTNSSSGSGSDTRNFSRKMSTEQHHHTPHNFIQVTSMAMPPPTSEDHPPRTSGGMSDRKSASIQGLTKMLGKLGRSRATSKSRPPAMAHGDWMQQIEAQRGIKGGILEIDEAAGAPVIRY